MKVSEAIKKTKDNQSLTVEETEGVFGQIFSSNPDAGLVRHFLVSLHDKGESFEEILGAVRYLRSQGQKISCKKQDLIDCCGTGGDQKGTINISTAVAFVLAGAGCHVAKHGNRAISSKSGSADVLSEMGVSIEASHETIRQCIDEIGIGFLFAPAFYPLMKKVATVRKSIPHRTIFNILGPLLNPAGAKRQLIGVFDPKVAVLMVKVLKELGSESVVAVCSKDGMDEFSLTTDNHVVMLKGNDIKEFTFDPRESGYKYCQTEELLGGTAKENAQRLQICLKGHSQAIDHTVHINAAWALMVAGKANDFLEALLMAQDSISSGRAYQKLMALIDKTNA